MNAHHNTTNSQCPALAEVLWAEEGRRLLHVGGQPRPGQCRDHRRPSLAKERKRSIWSRLLRNWRRCPLRSYEADNSWNIPFRGDGQKSSPTLFRHAQTNFHAPDRRARANLRGPFGFFRWTVLRRQRRPAIHIWPNPSTEKFRQRNCSSSCS